MFRVGLVTKNGGIISENFKTREEVDEYILVKDEELEVKYARILNKETGKREVITF